MSNMVVMAIESGSVWNVALTCGTLKMNPRFPETECRMQGIKSHIRVFILIACWKENILNALCSMKKIIRFDGPC